MKCDLCGGLVTWRGPLSALTHTECESCGGQNCQVVQQHDLDDEENPEITVGHSESRGGWCVYVKRGHSDYDVMRGPFHTQEEAQDSMARLVERSKTPNVGVKAAAVGSPA